MPHYEFKPVPNTPLTRVTVDDLYYQDFTSFAAAKAWVEHTQSLHQAWQDEDPRFVEAYGDQCQCYGCVTMRHPCVGEKR